MSAIAAWIRRHPVLVSSVFVMGPTAVLTVGLWYWLSGVWSVVPWLIAWLASINGTTFLTYTADKSLARAERGRVPEMTLFLAAFVGGSLGAMAAMQLFHHKTAKRPFRIAFWLIVSLQLALVLWIAKSLWVQE